LALPKITAAAGAVMAGICFGYSLMPESAGTDVCPGPADDLGRATRLGFKAMDVATDSGKSRVIERSIKAATEPLDDIAKSALSTSGSINEKTAAIADGIAESAARGVPTLAEDQALKGVRGQLVELLHKRELGLDEAIGGQFRRTEANLSSDIEAAIGDRLSRAGRNDVGDWFDSPGRTYDAVGPVPPSRFDPSSFTASIRQHINKQGLDPMPFT
jgi:hypothetical protein